MLRLWVCTTIVVYTALGTEPSKTFLFKQLTDFKHGPSHSTQCVQKDQDRAGLTLQYTSHLLYLSPYYPKAQL